MALTDNLTAGWKFDESSGDAADVLGTYTLTNNGTITYDAGLINNEADLGTSNTTKYFYNSNALADTSTSGAYSLSGWVTINTAPATNTEVVLYGLDKSVGRQHNLRYIDSGGTKKIRMLNWDGVGAETFDTNQTLTVGTRYHLVLRVNGNAWSIYLNNASFASGTFTKINSSNGSNGFAFGRHSGASFGYASMKIDEGYLYSREITTDEITELYNSGAGLQYPFSSGLPIIRPNLLTLGVG
jgi:hypothetical protein